jgi:Lon protease-like protein
LWGGLAADVGALPTGHPHGATSGAIADRPFVRPVVQEWQAMSIRPLAMFPLSTVLYPHADLPLHVFERRYRILTADCLATDRTFGIVLIDRGSEVGGGDHRVEVGTMARIEAASPQPDGRWVLLARGTQRMRVIEWLGEEPYPMANVEPLVDEGDDPASGDLERAAQRVRRLRALLSELGAQPPLSPEAIDGADPVDRMWRLCAATPINPFDRQRLLEAEDAAARLNLLAQLADEMADDTTRLLSTRPDGGDGGEGSSG